MSQEWCTIESDPGVFTELIDKIGVKDVQVVELYSLDSDSMSKIQPVYGLIFLFKWTGEKDERPIDYNAPSDLFFARQIITNACATQAILSVILNCDQIDMGDQLTNFKDFAGAFDAEMRGDAIGNLEDVRMAHNSFNRPDMFGFSEDKKSSGKAEDAFHFIAYVPFQGKVYELDGLKSGPICLGSIGSDEDWVSVVQPHIAERIAKYGNEIRFNLMAITRNLSKAHSEYASIREDRIKQLELARQGAESNGASFSFTIPVPLTRKDNFSSLIGSKSLELIETQLRYEKENLGIHKEEIMINDQLLASWKNENERRRTNYIPLAIALLKSLASQGKLSPAIEAAKSTRRTETM